MRVQALRVLSAGKHPYTRTTGAGSRHGNFQAAYRLAVASAWRVQRRGVTYIDM